MKGALGSGADPFWLYSYQNMIYKKFNDYCPEELSLWQETQDKDIQNEGNKLKDEIRDMLRKAVLSRFQEIHGIKWEKEPNMFKLKRECEDKIIKENEDNEDFNLEDHDWKEWIEIADLKKIIEKNFNEQKFTEAFAINVGLPFKTKKEKLAWIAMIEQTKGKKQIAMTRSDINRLWVINNHLQNFVGEDYV